MRDRFWVEEVRDQGRKVLEFARRRDEVHLLAMVKCVEKLYEATTALSGEVLEAIVPDEAERQDLRGARNFYVHPYHRVDGEQARRTVHNRFPVLVERAEAWLERNG